jgi:hypothetical protein
MYISFFEDGGLSTQSENQQEILEDRSKTLHLLFPKIYPNYLQMQLEISRLTSLLNSYRYSRLIKYVKFFQEKILKSR